MKKILDRIGSVILVLIATPVLLLIDILRVMLTYIMVFITIPFNLNKAMSKVVERLKEL